MNAIKSDFNHEQQAQHVLREGQLCLSAGRLGRAEMWLSDVVDFYPNTRAAREAEELLKRAE